MIRKIEHVQNAGTLDVPHGRFTNVWTDRGYSRFPGWLTELSAQRELARHR